MDLPSSLITNIVVGRGSILHSESFEDIDHGKFFVIIGENQEELVGFFFINSNISPTVQRSQKYLELQYPIHPSDYNFLRYQSFICASSIGTLNKKNLVRSIEKNETQIIDTLKEKDLIEILEAVKASPIFSKADKHFFE